LSKIKELLMEYEPNFTELLTRKPIAITNEEASGAVSKALKNLPKIPALEPAHPRPLPPLEHLLGDT
jgi:hypothetical protein